MGGEFIGAIAAALGTAIAAWLLDRWLGVRSRFKEWRECRTKRTEKMDVMLDGFPDLRDSHAELKDSVGRLTGQMRTQEVVLGEQNKVLATLLAMTLGEFEASPIPKFICDGSGRNINANAAYVGLLDVDREDLLGYGWRSRIPADMLGPWIAQFEAAQKDHRKFDGEISMRHSNGKLVRVRVHMQPFPPDEGPATHWVGVLTEVKE